jgi:hypothetical protein
MDKVQLAKVTRPTARRAQDILQQNQVLREITGSACGRIYRADPIWRIIEREPEAA